MTRRLVPIVERPGRRACGECGGDVGAACETCGGCGSLPPDLNCVCGRPLERYGWHEPSKADDELAAERLPRYFCPEGHLVAIRFIPVEEEAAA